MIEWNVLRTQCPVLAALLFALWTPAVVAQTSTPRVTLSGTVDPVLAGSDQSTNATFEITLPDGYHVNSDAPLDEFLKPTRLLMDAPDGVVVASIRYPEALLFATQFSEQPLAVYEHQFRIEVALTVAGLAPGDYPLRATLKYQACSDRICYPPATRQTEVTLIIEEG
jgi:DsbC/DsbD-like thiol-disulfide interchange protein